MLAVNKIAVLMAVKLLLLVMVPAAMADSKQLNLGGQHITGHKVCIKGETGHVMELFPAKPVPSKLLVGLSIDILKKDDPKDDPRVAGAFWHGDYNDDFFYKKCGVSAFVHAKRVYWSGRWPKDPKNDSPIISFYRPHNMHDSTRLSREEVDTQLASLLYVINIWGFEKVNLAGHAGGATIAMEAARRLPRHMVARVVLASPRLVVGGGKQNPLEHVKEMPKDIPIFVVHDSNDQIVSYRRAALPYILAAREHGSFLKLVKVHTNDHPYHHTQWRLGNHLRKPENSDFRPQRRF